MHYLFSYMNSTFIHKFTYLFGTFASLFLDNLVELSIQQQHLYLSKWVWLSSHRFLIISTLEVTFLGLIATYLLFLLFLAHQSILIKPLV